MRALITVLLSAAVTLLTSCSSDNKKADTLALDDPLNCSVASLNAWVDFNMRDYYYFADQVPVVNLADYDSPEKLIKDLRVLPNDRFSYVTTIQSNNDFFEAGVTYDLGFRWKRGSENEPRVSIIYPGGPFDLAGVNRGDIILTFNGKAWDDLDNPEYFEALGTEDNPGVTTWVFQDAITNQEKTVNLQEARYDLKTVFHHQTFSTPAIDGNIGYMYLSSFIENTEAELNTVFTEFKDNNVQELILDLRYNGGGRTRIARMLASLIAGPDTDDELLIEYRYNGKYDPNFVRRNFSNEPNALNLKRVIVLTTGSTASSSEIVINSLKPYVDVVTIGSRTVGKPYISFSEEKCDRSMNAIYAEGFNANGVSVLGGIEASCGATDNPVQDYPVSDIVNNTDEVDSMIGAAIDYLNTGACEVPVTIAASLRSTPGGPTAGLGTGPVLGDGF